MGITITVLAPAFYPSYYYVRYLMLSAQHHNVPVQWYGFGEQYKGWLDSHITKLIRELERVESTHVLFTDASDVIFLTGMEEIEESYRILGAPSLLVSVEKDGGLNAGGWMGEINAAKRALRIVDKEYIDGDPQVRWREAARDKRIDVTKDKKSTVFQVGMEDNELKDTCLLHLAGGFSDPTEGKKAIIEPIWHMLGYGS